MSALFDAQGRTGTWSAALHDVLAADVRDPRHHDARSASSCPGRAARVPGALHDGKVTVDGILLGPRDETAMLVVAVGSARGEGLVVAVEPEDLQIERRQGLDPGLGAYAVSGTTGRMTVLAEGERAEGWWEAAQARGRLALCRQIVAALSVMIEQARSHVSERVQFGRLVGTFQAVRHKLVEAHVATTAADCATTTAWESDDLPLAAATAKVVTGKAVGVTAANTQQLLAGVGFTAEHPFHRFMKRAVVLERMLGSGAELALRGGPATGRTGRGAPTGAAVNEPGTDDAILRSEGSRVRVLTLNRPASRNALDGPLHAAMLSAVRTVADEPEVRAVVLTGAGDAFSAGGDFGLIEQMQEDADLRRATLNRGRTLFWSLVALEIPVIAAVNGPAVGAGATLALLCDIVLMAEQAYLAEPRVSIGLVPGDGGAILWPLLAGVPAARAYLLTGDRMPAAEAHRLGLVHRVVERDALLDGGHGAGRSPGRALPPCCPCHETRPQPPSGVGRPGRLRVRARRGVAELRHPGAASNGPAALRTRRGRTGWLSASARVAVVTGGTRGLGAAIATRLAAEGTIVAAAYHEDDAAAERFVAQHRSAGVVTTHRVDVGDPDSCRALIADVVAKTWARRLPRQQRRVAARAQVGRSQRQGLGRHAARQSLGGVPLVAGRHRPHAAGTLRQDRQYRIRDGRHGKPVPDRLRRRQGGPRRPDPLARPLGGPRRHHRQLRHPRRLLDRPPEQADLDRCGGRRAQRAGRAIRPARGVGACRRLPRARRRRPTSPVR